MKVPPSSPLPNTSRTKPLQEAKLALLYWVRSQLEDYIAHHIIPSIQDFSRSWRSGLAFCLLIHRYDPDLLPTLFTELVQQSSEKKTWFILLTKAFDVAEEKLAVPKYLEPADLLVEFPHEPSVMMYVSEMYKVMAAESDTKREKRLHDITVAAPPATIYTSEPSESYSKESSYYEEKITPPESHSESSYVEQEKTTRPDIYEQLDTLSTLILDDEHEKESARDLFEQTHQMLNTLQEDIPVEEKQALVSRYKQLKEEWELLTKPLQQTEHISSYIRSLPRQEIIPRNDQHEIVHPLDGTFAMVDEFEHSLSGVDNEAMHRACALFRRGVMFGQITSAINEELNVIQQIMGEGTNSITDEVIQGLENRIHIVSASIQGVRDEYDGDLLREAENDPYFTRFMNCIDGLEDKYETVRDWVDQVRVWFKEAERIRSWIDMHIQVIEERNKADHFDPVSREMSIDDATAMELNEEHNRLKHEIDRFDSDDMDRLRAHVKRLTHSNDELTPADTSTIEITLTTLNMLNHLTNLLNKRTHFIQLLLHRVQWEDLFGNSVQWIANTDKELDTFLSTKARWSEKEEGNYTSSLPDDESEQIREGGIEDIIKTLVSLERKIADFDRGSYADVLDAYQEMEGLHNQPLPDYLEMRQLGFEKAFEDLMKRSGFSRKVVEQLLSMISTVEKFKELRDIGEQLRQHLLKESSSNVFEEDDMYAEKVQAFKEESARLITNASTCIPYPVVPEMSTAIGANDAHNTDVTNENIKSTISAYSMSLALIADALDQLLTSRYQVISLQSRADEAFEAMTRTKGWMDERIKLLKKARFDLMLYDKSFTVTSSTSSASSNNEPSRKNSITGATNQGLNNSTTTHNDEELHLLEKERDSIALRLHQMENDELTKLFGAVRALEYDVDASNAVSIDRDTLINCVESLEQSHQELKDMLVLRGLQLDALKKRVDWESQWSKTNSHLHTIARKMCDINIKKARYDPSKENLDKPSYQGDHEITQSLQFLQDRVMELDERYLTPLSEVFGDLNNSYTELHSKDDSSKPYSIVPDFILNKQSDLQFKYEDLKHLTSYTADLVTQRGTITEFLMRTRDAYHEGEKIKDVVSKKTRRIMVKEEEDGLALDERVAKFKQEIKSIWEDCGKNMSYPVYNGAWLKSAMQQQHAHYANSVDSNVTNSAYRAQVRAQIKSLLEKKMDELLALEKSIDQCIDSYRDADRMKALVNQYDQEACELGLWVNEQLEKLKSQYVDVSSETFLPQGIAIDDLKKEQLDMVLQADNFENEKVAALHGRIAQLVEDSLEKKKNQSVDVSSAARQLGEVMEQLSNLKKGLSDQAVTLEAACKRIEWEDSLQLGINRLEEMNEQVRQFIVKKNQLIDQEDLSYDQVHSLQEDLTRLAYQKNKFVKTILPGIQLAYDAFVEYFPKLSRPMATPDHLEARMESLNRSSVRLQENVEARSKELELIKQRMNWEDMVKKALSYLSRQEVLIENFVEEKARWQNDTVPNANDDDEETVLRTEWSNLFSTFKNYEEDVIQPLQKRYESIVKENTEHYNNTSTTILPSTFTKKMQEVQQAQDRTSYYFNFSNEVVTQRCLVSSFILRTAQLEQSAEVIREEFIASKLAGGNSQIVELLSNHSERLDKFKLSIDDVRNVLAASIPFPVRALENIPTQAKIKDETTNSVIKETINMRSAQLDEIWLSLQQLLETKERVSRRRLSLHSYKQQVKAIEAWIDSRYQILSKTNSYTLPNEEVDIEKLKDAVSQAESVEQAMKASDNLLTLLNSAYEKCVSAFEDKSLDNEETQEDNQEELTQELHEEVVPTQERLGQSWNALLEEVVQTNKSRTTLLITSKIQAWINAVNALLRALADIDEDDIPEDQLALFVNTLDQLKNKEYTNLNSDFEASKLLIEEAQIPAMQKSIELGLEIIESIENKISSLNSKLQLSKRVKAYLKDIGELQTSLESQKEALVNLYDKYKVIEMQSIPASRLNNHQDLLAKFKMATDNIADLKDFVSDVNSQFDAILKEDKEFKTNQQSQMLNSLEEVIEKESSVSLLVARSSKWAKILDILDETKSEIQSINNKISNDNAETAVSLLDEIAKVESVFSSSLTDIGNDLTADTINHESFESQRLSQIECLNKLKDALQAQIKHSKMENLVALVKQEVDQLCLNINKQLSLFNEQCERYDYTAEHGGPESATSIIADSKAVIASSQNKLDSLKTNQITELVRDYKRSEKEENELLAPIIQALEKLSNVVSLEEQHLDLELKLQQYLERRSKTVTTIESYAEKLAESPSQNLSEMKRQVESLDETIQYLTAVYAQVKDHDLQKIKCSKDCYTTAANTATEEQETVSEKYASLKLMLQEARDKANRLTRYMQVVSKLKDILSFITTMTERCNSFQVTGKAIMSEERELNDMCSEFYQSYEAKRRSVDTLIGADVSIKDEEDVKQLEDEIKTSMDKLELLIEMKKKEASREGDLTVFLGIMDNIDKQLALLTSAINKASPHYSALVNDKFVKSDLQSLLRNLVTAFKQHRQEINGFFNLAQAESSKQYLEESSRVKDMLQKASKRWTQTQAAAASRERELQTCINQLDHEFFTKLAMAKTTPHITHRILQSTSQGLLPRRGESSRHLGVTSPIPSAIRSSSGSKRASKTPLTGSLKRKLYVPDPDNELDMRLGQIVNSSPYKITVKIVPDQVGKYWFGDVNPRLVYCRILPSQVVMVRVGGGWVELSQ